MDNVLHELYHGNIRPCEGRFPRTDEYKTACEEILRYEGELLSRLNDEGKELYKKLTLALIPRDVTENAYIFEDAFKLGFRIALTCLTESGDA